LLEAKIHLTLSSCKNKLTLQESTCHGRGCGEAVSRFGSTISFRGGFDVLKTYSWDLESDFDAQLAHPDSEATSKQHFETVRFWNFVLTSLITAAFRDRRQEDRVEHAGDMLSINFSLTVIDLQHCMMKYPASVLDGELYPGKNFAKYRIEKCIGLFWFLFPQRTIEKPIYRLRLARSREHRATNDLVRAP
jgi:hypothetical protein